MTRMLMHFSGVAGQGMNPLAQLMRSWGHEVQGSDRSFDQGQNGEVRERLERAGIRILPQDGQAVHARVGRFVYSAAVELETPESQAALKLGVASLARPGLLAEVVDGGGPGVAISGTSGKSTVVGMLAWILRSLSVSSTVLGGAALAGEGTAGCFAAGPRGGPVVAEACESDGTLIGYHPTIGVIHNITRDHGEIHEVRGQFATFAAQCRQLLVNAACAEAMAVTDGIARTLYGMGGSADLPLEVLTTGPHCSRAVLMAEGRDLDLHLQHPGAHNLENACAALAAAQAMGLDLVAATAALATFPGVSRRFEVIARTDEGLRIVDDFAHNGAKIAAAVAAAQAGGGRVLCVFQPHGFGPARQLRPELRVLLPQLLRSQDRWLYLPIYYAGGNVTQDISSEDLAKDVGVDAVSRRSDALVWLAERTAPGDTVLIMGARDPSLGSFARALAEAL
jgi:UDP-N-acetylmuramate--alanine ligase